LTGLNTPFKIEIGKDAVMDGCKSKVLTKQYSSSASPLIISSNIDFVTNGWSGEGTEESPYIMEGIEVTNASVVVSISSTDAFFVIRDSNLTYTGLTGSCVAFDNVVNGVIENCTIISDCKGIEMNYSQSCKALNNTIGPCITFGIHLYESSHIQVSDNEIKDITNSDLSFYDACIYVRYTDDSIISENGVSNAPHLVYLSHSDRIEILSNNFVNPTQYDPLVTVYTDECVIKSNVISSSARGMNLNHDTSCLVENNTVTVYDSFGIMVRYGYDFIVRRNNVSGFLSAYDFQGLNNFVITDNIIHHSRFGMVIQDHFIDSEVFNNTAYACDFGFFIQSVINAVITGCTAYNNDRGFYVQSASECGFYRNIAFENNVGFELAHYGEFELIGNLVYNNSVSGISIWNGCTDNVLYKNSIISDSVVDNGANNTWDNGVNQGNYWDDYGGVGYYDVPGMASSQDRYPSTYPMPVILDAQTIEYEYSTIGNEITWPVFSIGFPDYFEVYREGILIDSDYWDGNDIVFPADGLDIGTHNFTLTVYDYFGNSDTSSGMVIVTEFTPVTTTTTTTAVTTTSTTTSGNGSITEPIDFPMIVTVAVGTMIFLVVVVIIVRTKS
jgi:parallel beta-helix repeat protein